MRRDLLRSLALTAALLPALPALAKLPALSDDAKAKAAVATARTAWSDKVAAYQLCQSQDRTAEAYRKTAKDAGKDAPAPVATPPCADPGPFVAPAAAPAAAASAPALEAAAAHSPANTATAPPGANMTTTDKKSAPLK